MSPLVFIAMIILLGATILHIVGVATVHWLDFKSGFLLKSMGLFKHCSIRGSCTDSDADSTLQATRAFCIIGVLLAFATIGLVVLFVIIKSLQSNKLFPIMMLIAGLASCGSILVGVIIFATEDNLTDVADFGYSFALSIVGALGIGAGGLLSFIGARASAS